MKNSKRSFSIFVVFFILMGSWKLQAQAPLLHHGPMLECSGLPCIDVTVSGGKHLRMLLDTGNAKSILDESTAKEMGLVVEPMIGRDGKPRAGFGRAVLAGAKLSEASLGDIPVVVMDLAPYIKKDVMPSAQGSLAYTAFRDRILALDYKRHTIGVSEVQTHELPCPASCGAVTTPTFGKDGPPVVVATGFSVNGKAVSAQIDTLFSGTMLIYPTAIAKLGLEEESRSTEKKFFRYTDGGVDMIEGQAQVEGFGQTILAQRAPIYFATADVHLPGGMFDATVGHELFKHSVLTLDLHANRIWLIN